MDRLNRDILRLSLPAIVSNVTVPLLGLCDTAISGHLGSELFLASIAVGTVMLNVVFWMFGFLRGGTTGLTAVAFGAKDETESLKIFYRALSLGLIAGILLISLQFPLFFFLEKVSGCSPEIRDYVHAYFRIRIWGSPAILATMAINGWFIGMQTTVYPMAIAIGTNILNIVASFILVFSVGMGFDGVATGTLIADWTGLAGAIGCLIWFRRGKFNRIDIKGIIRGEWRKFFSVNGNLFLRSFFIICVTMGVTAAGARLGNLTLAVNVIVMQFFQFFSFFMDGFAFSGEALVGRHIGDGNFEMLKRSISRLFQWTLFTGLFFSILYMMFTTPVAGLLTDSETVVNGVTDLWIWIILIPVISCWAFILDGFYIGLTQTGKMMLSTLMASVAFFITVFVIPECLAIESNGFIWSGFLIYLGLRGLILWLYLRPSLPHN